MKTHERIRISVIAEQAGFWVVVRAAKAYSYVAEYIAIGPSGQQMSGQVSGFSREDEGFSFTPVPFEVLKVALVSLVLVESKGKRRITPAPAPAVPSWAITRARVLESGSPGKLGRSSHPGRIELIPGRRATRTRAGSDYLGYGAYAYSYISYSPRDAEEGNKKGKRKRQSKKKRRTRKT